MGGFKYFRILFRNFYCISGLERFLEITKLQRTLMNHRGRFFLVTLTQESFLTALKISSRTIAIVNRLMFLRYRRLSRYIPLIPGKTNQNQGRRGGSKGVFEVNLPSERNRTTGTNRNHSSANKGLPPPLGRGVCETKSQNGRSRPRKPFICSVFCARRGIETMVSDHGLRRGQTMG